MQMSDIIAVLSLFVAIFAAMAIPFGLYIEKQTKDLAAAQERLSETLEQLAIQNESFSETVQAVGTIVRHTASRDQFLSGIIKCLLDCNPTLVDRAPFISMQRKGLIGKLLRA